MSRNCAPRYSISLLTLRTGIARRSENTSIQVARSLKRHMKALGGVPSTRPLVFDPFTGGGSIPLEALRVGADAFASDLNPVPVLLNKVVLEYVPKYGERLIEAFQKSAAWISDEATRELVHYYGSGHDGQPATFIWFKTIISEAPGAGTIPIEVPLLRSMWLAKGPDRNLALRWVRDAAGNVVTRAKET